VQHEAARGNTTVITTFSSLFIYLIVDAHISAFAGWIFITLVSFDRFVV